jgi:hypothetical protein
LKMGPGRDAAWLASGIPTVNMSCDWLRAAARYIAIPT